MHRYGVLFVGILSLGWAYQEPLPERILVAQTRMGGGLSDIAATKLEAALALAFELTGRYSLVPTPVRDSLVESLLQAGHRPTALAVAQRLGCRAICFALAERFVHLLRVELVLRWAPTFELEQRGTGYALVRHVWLPSGELLPDPALLEAAQRAVAAALGDSTLYAELEPPFRISPASLLAVGSIAYSDDPQLPTWKLFQEKVVTSYDAVLNIIDTARFHPRLVVCDIDTRDSIYARGGWMEPENYNPPAGTELELLARMGVEYYVSGSFERFSDGALLRLELYRLSSNGTHLQRVGSVEGSVTEDSVPTFRSLVRRLAGQLLWQSL